MIGQAATASTELDPSELRKHLRSPFRSTAFLIRVGKRETMIRLKDLSCGGACGLVDEAFAIGDYLTIMFDDKHVVEAQVRWVRRFMIGVQFSNPIKSRYVNTLYVRHVLSMKPEIEPY